MTNIEFRRISTPDELNAASSAYDVAFNWLAGKGIRQWLIHLSRADFERQQSAGQNYGLFCDGVLAVYVSLSWTTAPEWKNIHGATPAWWLKSLASGSPQNDRGLGGTCVERACAFLTSQGAENLYLDCLYGFLPSYYARLGFAHLDTQNISYPPGVFQMVLMRRQLKSTQQMCTNR